MKKFFAIIALVFITIMANAQKIDNKEGHFFKVGDYTFSCNAYAEFNKAGVYTWYSKDYSEVENLATFIKNNKVALEKKFGVDILDLEYGYSESHYKYVVFMTIYEHEAYLRHKQFEREAKEKVERMNSLSTIF